MCPDYFEHRLFQPFQGEGKAIHRAKHHPFLQAWSCTPSSVAGQGRQERISVSNDACSSAGELRGTTLRAHAPGTKTHCTAAQATRSCCASLTRRSRRRRRRSFPQRGGPSAASRGRSLTTRYLHPTWTSPTSRECSVTLCCCLVSPFKFSWSKPQHHRCSMRRKSDNTPLTSDLDKPNIMCTASPCYPSVLHLVLLLE